jgi:hypothetical protein
MSISTPNRPNGAAPTSAGLSEGLPQYVQDFVRRPPGLLIDGEWVEAASGNQVVQGISHAARKIKVGPGLEAALARPPAVAGRAASGTSCNQPCSRHQQGLPDRPPPTRGHTLDQLLQRVRRRNAVRQLQGIRLGPGNGPQRRRQLPRNQVSSHPTRIAKPVRWRGLRRAPPPPLPLNKRTHHESRCRS